MHKYFDNSKLALKGIFLATKNLKFWYFFIPSFLFFGILLDLLSTGTSNISLLFTVSPAHKITLLFNSLLNIFIPTKPFLDQLLLLSLTLLQSLLITLTIVIWQSRNKTKSAKDKITFFERTSLASLLAILGTGCPTCGTSLLAPLLSSLAISYSLASTLPLILSICALGFSLFSLQKIGFEIYAIMVQEKYLKKEQCLGKQF